MGGGGRGLACQWLIMGGWPDRQGRRRAAPVSISTTHIPLNLYKLLSQGREWGSKKLKGGTIFSSRFLGHDCHLGHHGGVERRVS